MRLRALLVLLLTAPALGCQPSSPEVPEAPPPAYGAAFLEAVRSDPAMAEARLEDSLIVFTDGGTAVDTAVIPTLIERNRTYTFVAAVPPGDRRITLTRINYTDLDFQVTPIDGDPSGAGQAGTASLHPLFWLGAELTDTPDGTVWGVEYRSATCTFMVGELDGAPADDDGALYLHTSCGCPAADDPDCTELFSVRS